MCGRYLVTIDGETYVRFFQSVVREGPFGPIKESGWVIQEMDNPKYKKDDIRPTDKIPVAFAENKELAFKKAHWGILPHWAANDVEFRMTRTGNKVFKWKTRPRGHFNSRVDTLSTYRGWKDLLQSQRCIVVANGFYEWSDDAMRDKSQPKIKGTFKLKGGKTFAFAAIWDKVLDENEEDFYSFSIITVPPNNMLKSLPHHRMPAILKDEEVRGWLDTRTDPVSYLKTTEDSQMEFHGEEMGAR